MVDPIVITGHGEAARSEIVLEAGQEPGQEWLAELFEGGDVHRIFEF